MNLQKYMSDAIRRIMAKAYRNVLSNPREAKTVLLLSHLMSTWTTCANWVAN